MHCAVVDVAHLLTTAFLADGEVARARSATEAALLAAPYDAVPKLDLAAVTLAEGHLEEARRIVREDVIEVTDEDGLPAELGERTKQVLAQMTWCDQRVAS